MEFILKSSLHFHFYISYVPFSIILVETMVISGREASRKLGIMTSDAVPMPNVAECVEVTLRVSIAALTKTQLCSYLLAKIGKNLLLYQGES